ncbi:MAG TPA: DUF389 domain-containing protein [Frankiaceae bacterium]|nr:DUF389 domain-containing protein [Frankiaceae bacterium]
MLHLRIVSPPEHTDAVLAVLRGTAAAFNLTLQRGAALQPAGDLLGCDVAREGVNDILTALRDLGLHRDGSIAVEHIDLSLSDVAAAAERFAPGFGSDAAVWEEVDARVRDESALTAGFLAFLVVAALIAAVGLIEDSTVLIVGAMVVGPEFGPIAGLSVGLFKRRLSRVRPALATLALGLLAGIAAAYLFTLAADAAGLVHERERALTSFVVEPNAFSAVIAFLAGIVGTLSLTQAKAGALVGVLISVTTIPAAAAIGVSFALRNVADARGAAVQLLVNVVSLVVAGVATLWLQREAWERVTSRYRSGG